MTKPKSLLIGLALLSTSLVGACSGGGGGGGFAAAAGSAGTGAAWGGSAGSGGGAGWGGSSAAGGGGSGSASGGAGGSEACAPPLVACGDGCVDIQTNVEHCGACMKACPGAEVCVAGACSSLPPTCPCPLESYCDVASNTCTPGCVSDDNCSAGRYCDTLARQCKPGCRNSDECPTAETCVDHACVNTCPNCDDGNPCTVDSCVKGQCVNQPGNNGATCADDGNPCTSDTCQAGSCAHPASNEGKTCPNQPCTTGSVCKAGACTGSALPDATSCGATEFDLCLAGQCKSVKALCSTMQAQGNNYIYSSWKEPSGASGTQTYYSCQCPTSTSMKSDWPPGVTGIGGTPRYWSCQTCKSIPKSDPYAVTSLACW